MKIRLRFLSLLLLFTLITVNSYADDPDRLISYPPEKIMGFLGLDTSATAPLLQDGRATDLQNVKLSLSLDLKKRSGYSVINGRIDETDTDSPAITGIFDTEFSNGNSWTLVFAGTRIKYDNAGTWADVLGLGANPITTGQNNQWQCVMANDTAICTNDTDTIKEINATPEVSNLLFTGLSSTVTKAKSLIFYRNYLVLGNTVESGSEKPTRLRWSNVGTTETWTEDDFIDIASLAGDEIIGFAELYGELYIFLKKSIWKASLVGGDEVYVLRKVFDGIGAIARDSIKVVALSEQRTVIIFLDDLKRVMMYDGTSLIDIGKRIQPTLDTVSASRLPYAVSTFDGKSYYLALTSGGGSSNDTIFELQTEIFEWTKHDALDVNAFAQVKETTSTIKTYFGNQKSFVYWFDDSDLVCDVDCATGTIDSVGALSTNTITGGQFLLDSSLTAGAYTGATIKITSGTGVGEEAVILSGATTGVLVSNSFTTTPDSTSVYSIGIIDGYYNTKHYDLGSAPREKQFLGVLFWANEATSNEVTVRHAIDFGDNIGSETKSLAPSGNSLWDSALWDSGVWGTTGNKIYTVKLTGYGNFLQLKFLNNGADEDFNLYGFNILGIGMDTKQ